MKKVWGLVKKLFSWLRTFKPKKIRYVVISFIIAAPGFAYGLATKLNEIATNLNFKAFLQEVIDICNFITKYVPKFICTIATITVLFFWILWILSRIVKDKKVIKKKYMILGHSSYGKTQFAFKNNYLADKNIVLDKLDLTNDFNICQSYNDIQYIVKKQDDFVTSFKGKITDNDICGYAGIAHTPLILRAGLMFGDEAECTLYHKERHSEYYTELSKDTTYPALIIEEKRIHDNADELIIAISTTFQISNYDLMVFRPEEKSIIKFASDEKGFDVILSRRQVDCYVDMILSEMRKIVKDKNITKIHLAISSSVAVTFELGRRLSKHFDPEIICYHFERNIPEKYPWGISVFKKFSESIVVNKSLIPMP